MGDTERHGPVYRRQQSYRPSQNLLRFFREVVHGGVELEVVKAAKKRTPVYRKTGRERIRVSEPLDLQIIQSQKRIDSRRKALTKAMMAIG